MRTYEIKLQKDSSEALIYNIPTIPLYIQTRRLEDCLHMRSFPHWHSDIELIYIENGQLTFHVNGQSHVLKKGHCCIVNSRIMHYSTSIQRQHCTYTSILFRTDLFTSNLFLSEEYVSSAIKNPFFTYYCYTPEDSFQKIIAEFVRQTDTYQKEDSFSCAFETIGILHIFWSKFVQHHSLTSTSSLKHTNPQLKNYQDMLSFIHSHYMDKISLNDIAAAGNISRNKCCAIFKHFLNCTPVDFLNQYRLELSLELLKDLSLSITDIAAYCGFPNYSYFIQLFHKKYGYTPGFFRKQFKQSSMHTEF